MNDPVKRSKSLGDYAASRNAISRMSELKLIAYDLRLGKRARQAALAELRKIEKELGIPGEPYNGG